MGPLTQKWKRKFEELTLIKESLEKRIKAILNEVKSTAQIQGSIREVQHQRDQNERDARRDPDNAMNLRFKRTPRQRKQRGAERRL